MTAAEEEALRGLLRGYPAIFPVLVYEMLGGDPNDFPLEKFAVIAGWLDRLGYKQEPRPYFSHAHFMAVWVREDWPGETLEDRRPITGPGLRADPELADWRAERRASRRDFFRRVREAYG